MTRSFHKFPLRKPEVESWCVRQRSTIRVNAAERNSTKETLAIQSMGETRRICVMLKTPSEGLALKKLCSSTQLAQDAGTIPLFKTLTCTY